MSTTSFPRVGIEWAEELEGEIAERLDEIPCLELIPENFFDGRHRSFLQKLAKKGTPVLVHAVEISFGSAGEFREEHFRKCIEVMDQVNTVNLSDHLCLTEAGGIEIGQLTPIPWNQENLDVVCRNVEYIQKNISVPFLIENVTNRFLIPNQQYTETEFINTILNRTGCELLLDITNVYTNSVNFKFDPRAWLDEIDYAATTAIHLAGGYYDDEGALVDAHSRPVPDQVWDLFKYVLTKFTPQETIVEWTEETPPVEEVIQDMNRAKEILLESVTGQSSSQTQATAGGTL